MHFNVLSKSTYSINVERSTVIKINTVTYTYNLLTFTCCKLLRDYSKIIILMIRSMNNVIIL